MLRKRIFTAVLLMTVLLLVLWSKSFSAFILLTTVFFAGAIWEIFRLFENRYPILYATFWTICFGVLAFTVDRSQYLWVFVLCTVIWFLYLVPSMMWELPELRSPSDRVFESMYSICLFGTFSSLLVLYKHSAIFLISVLAVVWIADIGAYFFGRTLGKHKLAPSISPGKTWEGALGGWVSVLVVATVSITTLGLHDTLAPRLHGVLGWTGLYLVLTILVAASILGDLLESKLKRRQNCKDSSSLLPGHGGILDRVDSLIPVLPIAVLLDTWLY